jgi:hypothetical protein
MIIKRLLSVNGAIVKILIKVALVLCALKHNTSATNVRERHGSVRK